MTEKEQPVLPRLTAALAEVETCRETLEERTREARAASAAETTARNNLNRAQADADRLLAELRKAQPVDTEWRRADRKTFSVETP